MSDRAMALFVSILNAVMDDSLSESDTSDGTERDLSRYDINQGNLRRRALRDDIDSESDDSENQPPLSPRATVRSMMSLEGEECKISVDRNPHHIPNISGRDSPMDIDNDGESVITRPIPSLLDLAAQCVAKSCTCEKLEFTNPPLDEPLLRKIAFWAFPSDEAKVKAYANMTDHVRAWIRGQALVKEGKVKEMWQVGFMATAYLAKYGKDETTASSEIRVSLTFEQQRILSSTCSECKSDIWCTHVVAAVIYRMQNPDKVIVHAPMTETLSTLDRNQLQKLLQYAVQEDPAGILGKVFKHIDSVRDTMSEMNLMQGVPDPTFGALQLEKSHWDLSVEVMEKTLSKSLSNLTAGPTFTWIDSSSNRNKYYPDCFDQTKKQHAHMNWFNSRVVELVRNGEYQHASQVLIVLLKNVITKLKEVAEMCSRNLKRYFHDLCRFYALTMMFIQEKDKQAWRILETAAIQMNNTSGLLINSLKTSQWAELPSLASCIRDTNLEETDALYEPIAACRLQPPPDNFYDFLDGGCMVEKHPYDESIPVMFARLQALNLFGKNHKNYTTRMTRLGLKILDKLSRLASQHSIINELLARTSSSKELDRKTVGFLMDRHSSADCEGMTDGDILHPSPGSSTSLNMDHAALEMPGISEMASSDNALDVASFSTPQPGTSMLEVAGDVSVGMDNSLPGPSGVLNRRNSQESLGNSFVDSRSCSPTFGGILCQNVLAAKTEDAAAAGLSDAQGVDLRNLSSSSVSVNENLNLSKSSRRKSPRGSSKGLQMSVKKSKMSPIKGKRLTRRTRSLENAEYTQRLNRIINDSASGATDQVAMQTDEKNEDRLSLDPQCQTENQCSTSQCKPQGATNNLNETSCSRTKNTDQSGPKVSRSLSSSAVPIVKLKPLSQPECGDHQHQGTSTQAPANTTQAKSKARKKRMSVGTFLRSPIRTRAKKRAASGPAEGPDSKRLRQNSAPAATSKGKSTPGSVGKGQKGKGPSKGKLPAKRRKLVEEEDVFPQMTGGQLAYSLMYSVHVVMKYEKKTGNKLCSEQLLLGYVLLALEMGYFRTVAPKDSTHLTEHDWLWRLEQSMSEYMQRKFSAKSKMVQGYLEAFKKVGLGFYDGSYPLVLLDNLSSMIALNAEQRQSWGKNLVTILAELLIVIPQSLDKYTLPTTSKYAYFIDNTSHRKNVHKDFVMYRIHNITSTLLSLIQVDNHTHEQLLMKILNNMGDVDMVVLLNLLMKDFKLQLYKLKNSRHIMEALLQFAIKAYRHTRCVQLPNDSVLKDQTFLFSLADNLGLDGLKYFLNDWKTLFNVKDIKGLIYLFESQIRVMDNPPMEVVNLIHQVLKESYACGMEACDLLSFFTVGDNNYKQALTNIQDNKGSYETSTLFAIAQQHWERKKGRNVRNLDNETMKILEAAMEQIPSQGSPQFEQLDWLFKVCTAGPVKDVHKSPQFQKMVTLITKYAASTPDVLLRILQNVEKTPSLLKHVESVSQALVGSYLEYFSSKLFSCSHSAYNNVINEMLRAKLDCKHYLKNGEAQFDERVVSSIRCLHRNRKKFIRMLDGEFPSAANGLETK